MKGIFTFCFFLIAFSGFAQKVDSVVHITTKKQYLSKIIGTSNSRRPLIMVNDTIYHGQMDSIDMNKVESLSVIEKGADKIYGKAARHGAVIIKTKAGYHGGNVIKGRDLIVVDGEIFGGKLTDLDPNSIFHVDVLNQQDAARFDSNVHSVIVILTKKSAIKMYQEKLLPYSESYKAYIKDHEGDDRNISYMVDGQSASIDTRYSLRDKNIIKAEFILTSNYPILSIITQ